MTTTVGVQAVSVDLLVNQYASLRARFEYRNGGVAQSLAGYKAFFTVSRRKGSAANIFQLTSDGGDIVLEPDDGAGPLVGVMDVFVPHTATALLTRNAVYDLVIESGAPPPIDVIRLFEGSVLVDTGVTVIT